MNSFNLEAQHHLNRSSFFSKYTLANVKLELSIGFCFKSVRVAVGAVPFKDYIPIVMVHVEERGNACFEALKESPINPSGQSSN